MSRGPRRAACAVTALLGALAAAASPHGPVGAPPASLVDTPARRAFYRKHLDAAGLPVLGSARVSDYALREAAYLVDHVLAGRDDIRRALSSADIRVVVMAPTDFTTDVPEHADLWPARFWDYRARGLGARPDRPVVSASEESLLALPGDPYAGQSVFVHEFAHAIESMAMPRIDPAFEGRLRRAYDRAMRNALWPRGYAAANYEEYWACGVQAWFGCGPPFDLYHNEVGTRDALERYDPELAGLLRDVFRDNAWGYVPPDRRPEPGHLQGYDRAGAGRFRWPDGLREWYREFTAELRRQRLPEPATQAP